jgi:uncharacterized protein (DUF1499 family)
LPAIARELSYMNWPHSGALLGASFAVMAVLLLAISPVGWLAGWWHYSFAFRLMAASAVAASAAAIVSLLTLVMGWSELNVHDVMIAGVALALGVALAYVPWQYNRTLGAVPRIHDITTDTDNPPPFAAVLPARAAEQAATVVYEGPQLARLQKAAYPDVLPLQVQWTAAEAFERALETATAMPGWTIVASEPSTGRIEASQRSRWFRFTDDIVIRVSAEGSGSRIDMRSTSRQGRSDFGVNAARIRSYMTALKQRIGG